MPEKKLMVYKNNLKTYLSNNQISTGGIKMNRRKFLKKSAVVAGTAAAATISDFPYFFTRNYAKAAAGDTIKIGILHSLSGTIAIIERSLHNSELLAIDEINAAGGVNVGGEKRPFTVEVIDTRDLEPGVPVSEALMAVERLILNKKADFLIGGPVRSEAALAAMPLL